MGHQADVSRVQDHSQTSHVLWEMSPVGVSYGQHLREQGSKVVKFLISDSGRKITATGPRS